MPPLEAATPSLCDGPHSAYGVFLSESIHFLPITLSLTEFFLRQGHGEPELHQLLKPGTVGFGSVGGPATWIGVPTWVWPGSSPRLR